MVRLYTVRLYQTDPRPIRNSSQTRKVLHCQTVPDRSETNQDLKSDQAGFTLSDCTRPIRDQSETQVRPCRLYSVRQADSTSSSPSVPKTQPHVVGMLRFKPTELAHSFLFCMALSTVFHSINSPDNSPLSHSVLPVLFLPYWSF